MNDEQGVDLDRVVEFYSPHSGQPFHGAVAAPPQAIMDVVLELVSAVMPLRSAIDKLKAVGIGHVEVSRDAILLFTHSPDELSSPSRTAYAHCWRLLRFQ